MSDGQASTSAPRAPTTSEWEGDLPLKEVRELFVTLGKAFRAYQLYDENNPVRRRFVENLREAFQAVWGAVDRLQLYVEEDRITLRGEEIYRGETRADSLSFLFFKDGVRELTFLPGIETEELERFLGVLQRARKLLPEGDDLITVLWEEDLQYFKFQYIDFLAEGVSLPEPGAGNTQSEMKNVLETEAAEEQAAEEKAESGEEAAEPGPQTVSQDDFNPTLYALDPREMQVLSSELKKEIERDLRGDVLAALFDRLEESQNRERQSEILGILATLLPNFLSRGALKAGTEVLKELRALEAGGKAFDAERLEESRRLLDEASAPETLSELIQALYDGSIRTTPQQLAQFLSFMRPRAMPALLRASMTIEHKELQVVLRQAVQGIAQRNREAVVALLQEEDAVVARGAARLVGDMRIAEAGPALASLLAHADSGVRLAAVEAAVALKASTAAGALERTLDDPDRDVRIAAAKALGELGYRPAGARLAKLVAGKEIRSADIAEKVALFEAYGRVAQEAAVEQLDQLLNGKGFLGKREPSEIRAAAALGLGQIEGQAARAALQKAVREEDAVVRSAVNRALRKGE